MCGGYYNYHCHLIDEETMAAWDRDWRKACQMHIHLGRQAGGDGKPGQTMKRHLGLKSGDLLHVSETLSKERSGLVLLLLGPFVRTGQCRVINVTFPLPGFFGIQPSTGSWYDEALG